jgi:hypothetical protein
MLSPVDRASRHASGDPLTRSGCVRDLASRHPRQMLHGRRPPSASAHSTRARRSSTNASFPAPDGPWTRSVRPSSPRSADRSAIRRAVACPRLWNPLAAGTSITARV